MPLRGTGRCSNPPPHDFLSEEGVRLGLQLTYLDETIRITRCTTRALAASCAVHVREGS